MLEYNKSRNKTRPEICVCVCVSNAFGKKYATDETIYMCVYIYIKMMVTEYMTFRKHAKV